MDKRLNFEDNIFILNVRIRMIQDLLILDADPEMFLNKTLDDLDFIDKGLETLLNKLRENTRLIDRDLQFHNLSETERFLGELLGEFLQGHSAFSTENFPAIRDKLAAIREHSKERRKCIGEQAVDSGRGAAEGIVSSDELQELLSH